MTHICAPAFANTIESNHVARELVVAVPLPEDKGLRGDGRPHVRRFRSLQLELGERLATFRGRYEITQAEVARAVGARGRPTVSLWESGGNVPNGMLREHVVALLEGQRWPELREAMLGGSSGPLPEPWERAVRWYRRASRERRPRETVGMAVNALLGELRDVETAGALRHHNCDRDGDWAATVVAQLRMGGEHRLDMRQVEDAAFGLRWLELARRRCFELDRSLVAQLPLALLDQGFNAL